MEVGCIKICYRNKTVEKLCTDLKRAKKDLSENIAVDLHSLINLLENAESLQDVCKMRIYYLHPLQGKRSGQYALDISGRKAGYRLVIIPLDSNGNPWKEKDASIVYKSTQVILVWEVTNHYD